MRTYRYAVSMQVPLGIRLGRLVLYEQQGRLSGELEVLGHIEPLAGTIGTDGRCEIAGNIISAVRTIPYRAVGAIKGQVIHLTVHGEKDDLFYITVAEE